MPRIDILADYLPRTEAAGALGKSDRTLARWENQRIGPAVTYIGRTPYYSVRALQAWLEARQRTPPGPGKRRRAA